MKICGLCKNPISDGRHKSEWVEVRTGRIKTFDCPYYVGFNGRPVIFIPRNQQDEQILNKMREDLHRREKILGV